MNDDGFFDEAIAARYDELEAERFDKAEVDPCADFLAAIAGNGPALEFAIGTGRVALPLRRRGVEVSGIELSRAMVAQLRAKPDGADIKVAIGDMTSTRVGGSFRLVYLVYNTVMNLTTQEGQVACFRNAAAHLEPGGCFVIEVMVPALRKLPPGETYLVFYASQDYFGIDEYDVVKQRLISHHIEIVGDSVDRTSQPCRYVWPAETDLMAELAGLRLRDRFGGWAREPFTADSERHVSVWEKLQG